MNKLAKVSIVVILVLVVIYIISKERYTTPFEKKGVAEISIKTPVEKPITKESSEKPIVSKSIEKTVAKKPITKKASAKPTVSKTAEKAIVSKPSTKSVVGDPIKKPIGSRTIVKDVAKKESTIEDDKKPSIRSTLLDSRILLNTLNTKEDVYSSRVELTGKLGYSSKKGAKRIISRLGFVAPIFQTADAVTFVTAIGLLDTAKHLEVNIGVGHRKLINPSWIIGGYGFYDSRKTAHGNYLSQATIGAEALSKHLELRTNVYIPLSSSYELSSSNIYDVRYNPHTDTTKVGVLNERITEQAVGGFDVEVGGSLPGFSRLELFAAHYYFNAKNVDPVIGGRLRGNVRVTDWLSLEGEGNYDKARKYTSYLGLRLGWNVGSSSGNKQSWVHRKMTQLPVRDIDIIEQKRKEKKQVLQQNFAGQAAILLSGFRPGIDELRRDEDTTFVDTSKENIIKLAKAHNISPILISAEEYLDQSIQEIDDELKSLAKEIDAKKKLIKALEEQTTQQQQLNDAKQDALRKAAIKDEELDREIEELRKKAKILADQNKQSLEDKEQKSSQSFSQESTDDFSQESTDGFSQESTDDFSQESTDGFSQESTDTAPEIDLEEQEFLLQQKRNEEARIRETLNNLMRRKLGALRQQRVESTNCLETEGIDLVVSTQSTARQIDEIVEKDENGNAGYTVVPPSLSNLASYTGTKIKSIGSTVIVKPAVYSASVVKTDDFSQESTDGFSQESTDTVPEIDLEEQEFLLQQKRNEEAQIRETLNNLMRRKLGALRQQRVESTNRLETEGIDLVVSTQSTARQIDEIVEKDENGNAGYTVVPPYLSNLASYTGTKIKSIGSTVIVKPAVYSASVVKSVGTTLVVNPIMHPINTAKTVFSYVNPFAYSWGGGCARQDNTIDESEQPREVLL